MNPATPSFATRTLAVAAYLVGLAGAAALGGRILLLGTGWLPDEFRLPLPWPWVIDVGWLLAFGLQHSGMARAGFKRRWAAVVPPHLERSCYVAASGLITLGMGFAWQPLGGQPFWNGPLAITAVPLLAGAAIGLLCLRFDHVGFFGLRQAWAPGREEPERLWVLGPYRYVRHPLMAGLLAFLWAHPVLTPTLAVLSGGLTLYIAVGLVFEERDLLRRFGPAYAAYRRRVPALIPWRRPAAPAVHPAVDPG